MALKYVGAKSDSFSRLVVCRPVWPPSRLMAFIAPWYSLRHSSGDMFGFIFSRRFCASFTKFAFM